MGLSEKAKRGEKMNYTIESIMNCGITIDPVSTKFIYTTMNGRKVFYEYIEDGEIMVNEILRLRAEFGEEVRTAYKEFTPAEREDLAAHIQSLAKFYGSEIRRLEKELAPVYKHTLGYIIAHYETDDDIPANVWGIIVGSIGGIDSLIPARITPSPWFDHVLVEWGEWKCCSMSSWPYDENGLQDKTRDYHRLGTVQATVKRLLKKAAK